MPLMTDGPARRALNARRSGADLFEKQQDLIGQAAVKRGPS